MAERTPLDYRYGIDQGRVLPPFVPFLDEYTFVLGAGDQHVQSLRLGNRIEVYQDISCTGIDTVRLDAAILQPSSMPNPRDVTGSPASATLKYKEILPVAQPTFHPVANALVRELYPVTAGDTLLISVNGAAEQTITIPGTDALTASTLAAIINDTLTGALASSAGDVDDPFLCITGSATGNAATLRITGGTLYAKLLFPLGPVIRLVEGNAADSLATNGTAILTNGNFTGADVDRVLKVRGATTDPDHPDNPNNVDYIIGAVAGPTEVTLIPAPAFAFTGSFMVAATFDGVYDTRTFYGGDALSALVAPAGAFTAADCWLPVQISGAANGSNNGINQIINVPSSTVVVLRDAVVSESAGFTAHIIGALWQVSVLIDDEVEYTLTAERGRPLYTQDMGVSVSKLSGIHKVAFRLQLLADQI